MSQKIETNNEIKREIYHPGDFIFFEGDLESDFYIIEQGSVQIYTKSKTGARLNICTIGAGESFGEFALLDNKPRSASAEAMEEVILVKVSAKGFEHLLSEIPVWASSMMKAFTQRLKNMNQLLKDADQFLKK